VPGGGGSNRLMAQCDLIQTCAFSREISAVEMQSRSIEESMRKIIVLHLYTWGISKLKITCQTDKVT
jgi:hypothetical protein